jgi:hypothetical protein
MTGSTPAGPDECDDYEYDLVHDELGMPAQDHDERDASLVSVELETDESSGDYGYDLAHDGR